MNTLSQSLLNISTGTWLDIAIVLILVLFTVLGLLLGFMKSLFSLVKFAGSFFIAYLLRSPCGAIVDKIFKITPKLGEKITASFAEYSPALVENASTDPVILKEYVNESSMGGVLKKIVNWVVGKESIAEPSTVSSLMSTKAGAVLSMVIAIAIVFILIRILAIILPRIFKKLTKKGVVGKLDRILGTILGLAKGVLVVFSMFFVMSFLTVIPSLTEKIENATAESKICSVVYEPVNNYIYKKLGIDKSK